MRVSASSTQSACKQVACKKQLVRQSQHQPTHTHTHATTQHAHTCEVKAEALHTLALVVCEHLGPEAATGHAQSTQQGRQNMFQKAVPPVDSRSTGHACMRACTGLIDPDACVWVCMCSVSTSCAWPQPHTIEACTQPSSSMVDAVREQSRGVDDGMQSN